MQLSLYTLTVCEYESQIFCNRTNCEQPHLTESETENRTLSRELTSLLFLFSRMLYAHTNSLDTNHNKIVINKFQIKQIAHRAFEATETT